MNDVRRFFDELMERQQAERQWLEARARRITIPTDYMEQLRSLQDEIERLPDDFARAVEAETETQNHKQVLRACLKRTRDAINAGNDFRPEWLALHDAWERACEDYQEWQYRRTQSRKGHAGADSRWHSGERNQVAAIYDRLASRVDTMGEYVPPADLWPALFGELDDAGLAPRETDDGHYHYDGDRGAPITYEAFRKAINRSRHHR